MPDKDLRKQALKGGKTVSKKAAAKSGELTPYSSKPNSKPSSTKPSRNASRIASRNVSDDEDHDDSFSDDTNHSLNSMDVAESEEFRESDTDLLSHRLSSLIDEIIERKGSSTESRAAALHSYNRMLMSHHFGDTLHSAADGLLAAFARSIRAETSPEETIEALRAVSLTSVSFSNSSLYELMAKVVKRTVSDSQDDPTKASAIHCLAACASFGGATESEIGEVCAFLLEIIESDGTYIGADDSGEVVTAAIQEYAYLATEIRDLEGESDGAVEALLDQLDSSDIHVQIAAGEAIALLFEKSAINLSDDSDDDEPDDDDDEEGGIPSLRYSAYHDSYKVFEKTRELATISGKYLSKRDKLRLHKTFTNVCSTVEQPAQGLMKGKDQHVVRLHKSSEIHLDKWWKYLRLNFLRRQLGAGFVNHYYEGNSQVINSLPLILRKTDLRTTKGLGYKARKGDLYRDVR